MSTDEQILGRTDVNDLEAILAITNTDVHEAIHTVKDNADAIFTWDYEKGARPALNKLYEKAKTAQWNGETDLDWSIDVDPEKVVSVIQGSNAAGPFEYLQNHPESPFKNFGDKEWTELGIESMNWRLSQFMHGEQGALVCTAKIVETVPWIDAKYYASTQVMDEARHVEVFAKYLQDKLTGHYPINAHLRLLLDDIIEDSRWDMTYLGMQIMVEGLALAAFGFMYQLTEEPLLKKLLRYVMSDEARHVAFGVLSLKEYYEGLSAPRSASARSSRSRPLCACGIASCSKRCGSEWASTPARWSALLLEVPPDQMLFQQMLFSKIVPNCKKLGLLDAADGWLRHKFEEIGVIQFEDWADTGEEYLEFDAVAQDRAAAEATA